MISEETLFSWAREFTQAMESKPTTEVCKCEWLDVRGKLARVSIDPMCPVHTQEGMIVGFVNWVLDTYADKLKIALREVIYEDSGLDYEETDDVIEAIMRHLLTKKLAPNVPLPFPDISIEASGVSPTGQYRISPEGLTPIEREP